MNKKTLIIILSTAVATILVSSAIDLIFNNELIKPDNPVSEEKKEAEQQNEQFSNIYIDVKAADIIIQQGDEYSLDYQLSEHELIRTCEIRDDTLTLITEMDQGWHPGPGDWKVVITIPEEKTLSDMDLKTLSGSLMLSNVDSDESRLETVSGRISIKNMNGNSLNAEAISDRISITESKISHLDVENKSDGIAVDGKYDEVEIKSISGDITLSAEIMTSAELETVSGDIDINSSFSTIHAESIRDIKINGQKYEHRYDIEQDGPEVNAVSISGSIKITSE